MTEFIKNNKTAILISTVTFVLAGVAIFTAWRLYRMQSTAPQPSEAQEQEIVSTPNPITESCEGLAFAITVNAQETSPTPTPTATGTSISSSTATPTPTSTATSVSFGTDNPTSTPTNTPTTQLPDAGVSIPTLLGISFGGVLLLAAALLAI